MGQKITITVISIALLLLESCSSGNDVAGTGSSTGNANVGATISGYVTDGELPAKSIVQLIPADYNPKTGNNNSDVYADTTDSLGYYSFALPDTALTVNYNLNIEELSGTRSYFEKSVIASNDTLVKDSVTLVEPGVLKIIVSADSVDTSNGYLYIPGTNIEVELSDFEQFDSVNYTLYANSVPASYYSKLNYAVVGESEIIDLIDTTFTVNSSDTSVIGKYRPIIISYNSYNSGIPNDQVYSVSTDPYGGRWFGTISGEFARFTGDSGWVITDAPTQLGIASSILTISAEPGGRMWFGTHGAIFTISYDEGAVVFTPNDSPFPGGSVYAIAVDTNSTKWFACYGRGVMSIEGEGDIWTVYNTSNSDIISNNVYDVISDLENVKWLLSTNGISSYSEVCGFKTLNTQIAYCVASDSNNVKWFGLKNGKIASFDGNSFIEYELPNSISSGGAVHSVAVDKKGVKWFGTDEGNLFSFDGKIFTPYSDFIPKTASRLLNIAVDADDNKWVATETAGAVFISAKVDRN